jgi:hypothetical protein
VRITREVSQKEFKNMVIKVDTIEAGAAIVIIIRFVIIVK